MFQKKEKKTAVSQPPDKFDTIIGEDNLLEGNLTSTQSLRIDGKIIGDIKTDGTLHIGETGRVEGSVSATNVILSGTVEGNIESFETLRIMDKGKLMGNATIKTLIIDENGIFEGNSKMHQEKSSKQVSEEEPSAQKYEK